MVTEKIGVMEGEVDGGTVDGVKVAVVIVVILFSNFCFVGLVLVVGSRQSALNLDSRAYFQIFVCPSVTRHSSLGLSEILHISSRHLFLLNQLILEIVTLIDLLRQCTEYLFYRIVGIE